MKTRNAIIVILSILLALFIWRGQNYHVKIVRQTDTIKTTVFRDNLKYRDVIKHIPGEIVRDTVFLFDTLKLTDTVFVYNDYLTKYYYADTLQNDNYAKIIVKDTIYLNKIYKRNADIEIFRQQPKKRIGIFVGGYSLINNNAVIGINAGIIKGRNIISVGYASDKSILINYSYEFKLNTKKWNRKK